MRGPFAGVALHGIHVQVIGILGRQHSVVRNVVLVLATKLLLHLGVVVVVGVDWRLSGLGHGSHLNLI